MPAASSVYTDIWFIATDTGDTYICNGSSWVLTNGPSHQEEEFNKTINVSNNTLVGLIQDPFSSSKREGFLIPTATPDGALKYALKGWPYYGSYSYIDDSLGTEGKVSRFSTSAVENVGYLSNSQLQIISRMSWNTTFKTRVRTSTTSNDRQYIGFSSNTTLPTSDTPLGTSESGILIGFNSTASNYSIYRNDGSGSMVTSTFTTTKDTGWHNFEIIMSGSPLQVSVLLDDAQLTTYTTRIPALNTNLYLNCGLQSTNTTAKTLDIAKIRFNSNLT